MLDRIQNATFQRRLFLLHPAERFVVRVVSYVFLFFCVGATVTFLISDIMALQWIGIFLILMLIDYVAHIHRAHFSLSQFFSGMVPKNNIALCVNQSTTRLLAGAYAVAVMRRADMHICMLHALVTHRIVRRALERLEINPIEFRDRISASLEQSVQSKYIRISQADMEHMRQLCIGAALHALSHNQEEIGIENIFFSLVSMQHPNILRILDFYSIRFVDIDAALVFGSHTHKKITPYLGGFAMAHSRAQSYRVNRSFTSRPTPLLDQFALDVTDYVRDGFGGFLIGHENEFDRLIDILSRPGNRNALLVGDPGVGKEALVYHLAHRIVQDRVPGPLFDRRVVQLSLSHMLSGSTRENATGRIQDIVSEILRAGNILLYIPDAHLLEKSAEQGRLSLADVCMPIFKNGIFPVVGATTPKEYKQFIDARPAFADTFEVIQIQELPKTDAIRLLSYSALIFEKKYGVYITCSAIIRAVELAAKYIRTKPLPSSAQELLQETVVDGAQRGEKRIQADQVITIVERKLRLPVRLASGMEASQLLKLEDTIHASYIDQDEAVSAVARSLRAYRSGLARKGGPIASFLFVGPTGVGKTELTKLLASLYFGSESFLIRFDMSEYQEKEAVARFIGSSDGKRAGQLTEAVLHQPYSVVLLDEFEKAHSDILNLFLQVFDEGRLTDATGRTVDFQNTIIIATSNAHSVLVQEHVRTHGTIEGLLEELKRRMSEYFRPELINRFSDIIIFKPLSREDLTKIVSLQLASLAKQVAEAQGISLVVSPHAQEKIAHLGYDPAFGARPLRKVLDTHIRGTLSEKILSGELTRGSSVEVDLDEEGGFDFKF